MNWTDMPVFKGIDLNDSFVLSWSRQSGELVIDLEASIWPESPFYTEPKPDEYTCYRKATLRFVGVFEVVGLESMESVRFFTDANGEIDYGNIDSLRGSDSTYHLCGNFGEVEISGGELQFEVHT
jgi:hypothetical protein